MVTMDDLGLREFPFKNIPPTSPTSLWVGRQGFRNDLENVMATWAYRSESEIYLLWAESDLIHFKDVKFSQLVFTVVDHKLDILCCWRQEERNEGLLWLQADPSHLAKSAI